MSAKAQSKLLAAALAIAIAVVAAVVGYFAGVSNAPTQTVTTTLTETKVEEKTVTLTKVEEKTVTLAKPVEKPATQQLVVVDETLKYVQIKKPVKRVVVLTGYAAYILSMLNASDYIVGATKDALDPSDYWHLVLKPGVKNVGDMFNPNITAILELKPDLVIVPPRIGTKEVAKGLEEKLAPYGIPVLRLDLGNTCPVHGPYNVLLLGLIFDRQEEALKYVEWVNKVLGVLNERLKGLREEDKLTVFAMHHVHAKAAANITLPGYGPGAKGYRVTVMAGLRPVTHHFVATAYPRVTPKWVSDRNPDVIAIMGIESDLSLSSWIEEYEEHLGFFNGTAAVAKGRVVLLPHILDSGPGFPVAALYIAKIAYPDRFKDVDPNQYLCEFLQLVKLPCKGVWGYAGPNNPILGWK